MTHLSSATRRLLNLPNALRRRLQNVLEPARRGYKSPIRQLIEIARLRLSPTRLLADEYYWFGLFDGDLYPGVDQSTFCGSYMKQWLHEQLNSPLWDAVVTDKFVMSRVFKDAGIPHPEIYAIACRFPRNCGPIPVFKSSKELCKFLRQTITYPFFCKPVKGGSAIGCMRVESYNADADRLILADASQVEPEQFVTSLEDPTGWGHVFQEAVVAHPQTKRLCGKAVTGCRVVMLLDDQKAFPLRVTWKVPSIKNHTDNYVKGTAGNLLADIDLDTGVARRVVSGAGVDLCLNPKHPDTGLPILGEPVPAWNELMELMPRAALAFPGFRIQHWDVGLTSRGPVVYELNTSGGYAGDLATGSGIYDDHMKRFVKTFAENGRRSKFISVPDT